MGYLLTSGVGSPRSFGAATIAEPFLLNAEGYSDLLDGATEPYFPTPAVTDHPYRLFAADPNPGNFDGGINGFSDFTAPVGQNVFPQGSGWYDATFRLALDPTGEALPLALAIGASWGQAAIGSGAALGQRQQPVFYLPEFHHKAAWRVNAQLTHNALVAGDSSSTATLEVRIRDWQQGAIVDPTWTWPTSARTAVRATSEIATLAIAVPGVEQSTFFLDPASGNGLGVYEDRVYSTSLFNTAAAPAGDYFGWVQVTDSRVPPSAAVIDRTVGFGTVGDYHTAALVPITVSAQPNAPPTAILLPNPIPIACDGEVVVLDASTSSDPEDGSNVSYAFDLDLPGGDPANFVADVGPTSNPLLTATFTVPFPTHLALRVSDSESNTDIDVVPVSNAAIALQPPRTVQPADPGVVQTFNPSIQSGGTSLAVADTWAYVAVNSYDSSDPGATAAIQLYRSVDGNAWEALTPHAVPNPYGPLAVSYDLAAGDDGALYLLYGEPNNFPTTQWIATVATNPTGGTGPWSTAITNTFNGAFFNPQASVNSSNPNRVFSMFAIDELFYLQFYSTGGASGPWDITSAPIGESECQVLVGHPSGDFLSIGLNQVHRRIDVHRSGATLEDWFPVASTFSLPAAMGATDNACDVTLDPRDPTGDTMYCAFKLLNVPGLRLVRTTNAGVSWVQLSSQVESIQPVLGSWPTMVDVACDASGGLFVAHYSPQAPSDRRGRVVYSGDGGTAWTSDVELFWNGPEIPSTAGIHSALLSDGCTVLSAFADHQDIRSRTY